MILTELYPIVERVELDSDAATSAKKTVLGGGGSYANGQAKMIGGNLTNAYQSIGYLDWLLGRRFQRCVYQSRTRQQKGLSQNKSSNTAAPTSLYDFRMYNFSTLFDLAFGFRQKSHLSLQACFELVLQRKTRYAFA